MFSNTSIAAADRQIVEPKNQQPGMGRTDGDTHLFTRFLDGDDTAFLELFDRHSGRLGSYCRKMLGPGAAADDAMQDLWEQVLRLRESHRSTPPNPLGLLYWMARNLCLNRLRTQNRHSPLDALPERHHPSSEQSEKSRAEELILLALDRLPLEQREVLILNIYSGYTFEEIAEMTGENDGALRTRAWRARRHMKRVIAGLMELDDYDEQN